MTFIDPDLFNFLASRPDQSNRPFIIPWIHTPQTPAGFRQFSNIAEWQEYVASLSLHPGVWPIARTKFHYAQKTYFLGWLDQGLIKIGELAALVALELSLKERYGMAIMGSRQQKKKPKEDLKTFITLRDGLRYMVEKDGLTNEHLPTAKANRTDMVARLYERDDDRKERKKTFVSDPITIEEIRNRAAHGDLFEGLAWGGLFEVVRELIHYADRERIAAYECAATLAQS